jgi:hypothetical protein
MVQPVESKKAYQKREREVEEDEEERRAMAGECWLYVGFLA